MKIIARIVTRIIGVFGLYHILVKYYRHDPLFWELIYIWNKVKYGKRFKASLEDYLKQVK